MSIYNHEPLDSINKLVVHFKDGTTEEICDGYAINGIEGLLSSVTLEQSKQINNLLNEEDFMNDIKQNYEFTNEIFETKRKEAINNDIYTGKDKNLLKDEFGNTVTL